MTDRAYHAVVPRPGPGGTEAAHDLWACSDCQAVVYGARGQAGHDAWHVALAQAVEEIGRDLGAMEAFREALHGHLADHTPSPHSGAYRSGP